MFNLRRTNTEGQCRHCAMGRGVRIATNNGHTRQGRALLRSNNVNDALTDVLDFKLGDAKCVTVFVQGFNLQTRHGVNNARIALRAIGGRYIVVAHGKIGIDTPHGAIV